ncbi:MAG: AIR synthase-related protein [Chthoniobacteraceae bacterium]
MNHCIDDIAVLGAKPLFFLDYIGAEKLEPDVFEPAPQRLCQGLQSRRLRHRSAVKPRRCPACINPGEYDLAGTIVGVVDRPKMLDGSKIKPGDVIIGLPSNGLHTNGYSLARKVLLRQDGAQADLASLPGLTKTLGEELLRVHRNYQPLLASLPQAMLKGLAHITGGGLVDNLPRVLPKTATPSSTRSAGRCPPLFQSIQRGRQGGPGRDVSGLQHGHRHDHRRRRQRRRRNRQSHQGEKDRHHRPRLRHRKTGVSHPLTSGQWSITSHKSHWTY